MRHRPNSPNEVSYTNLESKRMMAGLSYNSGTGELKVNGSSGNDYVEVRYSGTKVQVDLYYIKPDGSTAHSKTSKNISAVTDITFSAQAGDDSMKVTQQNLASSVNLSNTRVQFIGDSGNDSVNNESAVRMHAFGGAGDDRLIGGISADQLFGDSGNDYLEGRNGNDYLFGYEGDDSLRGNEGNDQLFGGSGDDFLLGGLGSDTIHGDAGNDKLEGDGGNDFLYGEDGYDSIHGGTENDQIYGGRGNDLLVGENGDDLLFGGEGNDQLAGGLGKDTLLGEDGYDSLFGGDDEDQLYGGNGGDFLDGGHDGKLDALHGGAGADHFRAIRNHRDGINWVTLEEDWYVDLILAEGDELWSETV